VNPGEPVVTRANRDDALDPRNVRRLIAPLKVGEQVGNEFVRWADLRTDFDIALTKFAGSDRRFFALSLAVVAMRIDSGSAA
jgi:hypothetical protein